MGEGNGKQGGNGNPGGNVKLKGPLRKLQHAFRNARKKVSKNVKDTTLDGMRNLFKVKLVLYIFKIVIPIFVIIALINVALSEEVGAISVNSTASYYGGSGSSGASGNSFRTNVQYTSEEEKAQADAGANFYSKTGSLLLVVNRDIKEISNMYLNDVKRTNNRLYNYLANNITIGDQNIENIPYSSDFEIRNAYDYLLNAERLNFNNIVWTSTTYQDGKNVKRVLSLNDGLVQDSQTRLIYPAEENDDKDLKDFANMARPYLQSWIIPMSMFTGIADDLSNEYIANFIYRIVNDAYHRITIEQHYIRRAERHQTRLKYVTLSSDSEGNAYSVNIYNKYVMKCKDKVDEEGKTIFDSDGNPVQECKWEQSGSVYINSELSSIYELANNQYLNTDEANLSYNEVSTLDTSKYFDRDDSTEVRYVMSNAETFDTVTKVLYDVERYQEADVQNFTNPKLSQVVGYVDYYNCSGLNSYDAVNSIENNENVKYEFAGSTPVTVDAGTYETTLYRWEDSLNVEKRVARTYTAADVTSYINTGNIVDDTADEIDEFIRISDNSHYVLLEETKEINRIDIMNSKRSNFSSYVGAKAYSTNIGYSRSYLLVSYNMLKNYLSELKNTYKTNVRYGNSILSGVDTSQDIIDYDYTFLRDDEFAWPVPDSTIITSRYGWRHIGGKMDYHNGIDISISGSEVWTNYLGVSNGEAYYIGPNVVASLDGVVDGVSEACGDVGVYGDTCNGGAGRFVRIKTSDDYYIIYMHLYSINVAVGDEVKKGQIIGTMGTTGSSTGIHLHYEIREGYNTSNYSVDPLSFDSLNSKLLPN